MVYFSGDNLLAANRPRGLPIGNLTSQFWANCYLNPFDHFVNRELGCSAYLRYVDDFLLFADDKKTLAVWRDLILERLARFCLTLHEGSAHPRPARKGFLFWLCCLSRHCRLKRRKGIAYQRRLKRLLLDYRAAPLDLSARSLHPWLDQPCPLWRHMGTPPCHAQIGDAMTKTEGHQRTEMPIFTKTYDFLAWLVPLTNHFPRLHRHTVTRRLLDAALDFQEDLLRANNLRARARSGLTEADARLDTIRTYLRLAFRWQWMSQGQYEHAGRLVAELGRLLGGWQQVTRQQSTPQG